MSLKYLCLENLGFFVLFFFLESLNIFCIIIIATIRMIEIGEGRGVNERRKSLGKV